MIWRIFKGPVVHPSVTRCWAAAIVQNGFIRGVEAAEGTTALLKDAGIHPRNFPAASWPRPTQDRRIDLPAVGLSAVEHVVRLLGDGRDRRGTYCRPTEDDPRSRRGGHFPVRRISEKLTVSAMPCEKEVPLIWLIAGEPSGDLIGARLIVALRERSGGNVRIAGIGGEAMLEEGLESLFPISDIAVMGLIEIIPRILLIKRRMRETISRIESDRPDIVVSIDVPGFCYEIWKGLRGSDIPLVHYVAHGLGLATGPGKKCRNSIT